MQESSIQLLLVEDESDHARLVARHLKRAGDYDLMVVATATEALSALQEKSFDVVLLDYFLPDMNGLEFLERCRDLAAAPPIIMVTGQGNERIAVDAMKRGAADYLIKSGDYFSTINHVINRTLEQGRLRQRAAESEANYRRLFHTLADPILLVDLDTLQILKSNRQTQSALGFSVQTRRAFKLTDILRREGKPLSQEDLQKLLSQKSIVEFNCQLLDGNHALREVSLHVSSTSYGGRRVLLVLVRDVTERHHLIKKLQDSENRYRNLVDNALTGIFQSTLDGRFLMANAAMAKMFGYASAEELLGVDIKNELYLTVEDREKFIARILAEGHAENQESTLRKKDGTPIIIRENVRVVRDNERNVAYLEGIIQDITEQRRAEAEIQRLANFPKMNPNLIFELASDGSIRYFNPAVKKLLEDHHLAVEEIHQILPNNLHEICRDLSSNPQQHTRVEKPLGERIIGYFIYLIPGENIIHVYGSDITEQKLLAAQLLQSQKMESIGRLAGGIAHDFNNILMGIIGYVSLMLDEMKPGERLYDDLRKVEKTAQRAAEITRQLLAYSRKAIGHPEAVAANALIEETLQLFKRAAPPTVQVSTHFDPNLPAILIDPLQFQQVLMNLFVNANDAIAAAPDAYGGGTLVIKTSTYTLQEEEASRMVDTQPGEYVLITISDSGIGVASEDLSRIFEPFYTTKGVGQGTGLGLAMVYGIVKAHGGLIRVDSEKGKGTEFRLYFPVHDGSPVIALEIKEELPRGTETILLVDDEESLTTVGKRILEKFGYEVITAHNGVEALEFYSTHKDEIDLVLLDMTMPKMDGSRLLRELVRVNPQVKAIMYSGYSHPSAVGELLQSGSRRFLQKPYRPEDLVRTIREVLDGKGNGKD